MKKLVSNSEYLISEHGYEELVADRLLVREVAAGLNEATEIESYPDYPKGPCVLVLQKDEANRSIHVIWGIPKGNNGPAVLVMAYRPSPERCSEDFLSRNQ